MTEYGQVVIWLTHEQARIVEISDHDGRAIDLRNTEREAHADRSTLSTQRELADFYDKVAESCDTADQVLLLGRETVTNGFHQHLRRARLPLAARVVGCAPGVRPTDREMLEFGRTFFRLVQQARGSAPIERRDRDDRPEPEADPVRPKFRAAPPPQQRFFPPPTFGFVATPRPARLLPAGRWSRPGATRR
ncbi:MAG: Translational machinery protein [Ilumatobacteraceae bacterium]|nr:Translational machinery protein [Ilumatobacteraceae bacterium]MCU1391174.1 Translational machinery protein [Ilumatobacteraceae bacterium]